MSNEAKQPTIDFLQIFCMNFKSHFDLSGEIGQRRHEVIWPAELEAQKNNHKNDHEQLEKIWRLRYFRQVLEVIQEIIGRSKNKKLAVALLELYAPTPIEVICPINFIVESLIVEGLIDSNVNIKELESVISESYDKWMSRAVKESKEILVSDYPDIDKFEGKTGFTKIYGVDRWGPINILCKSLS
jgi:hypothetical protein